MTHDRIWYLLGRKMASELLPEEGIELEHLLQQHPDASYIKEVMMQQWKDKQKDFSQSEVESALQRHRQRLREAEDSLPVPRSKVFRMFARIAGVAAAVLAVFFAGRMWLGTTKSVERQPLQQLVTQNGARSHIKLPDGTRVWLNAGSKLDYPRQFASGSREVSLEGEAYFDVVKDAGKPFIVKTKTCAIRVLGTTFNVRAYPQESMATTSLVTGSVEVMVDEKVIRRLLPNEKLSIPVNVVAVSNTTVTSNTPSIKIGTLTQVKDSVMAETAWVDNKLAFRKLPLGEIAKRMEQWYGTQIRFKNEDKKQLSFSAVFEKENLIEALQALELGGGFHFTKDTDSVIWIE